MLKLQRVILPKEDKQEISRVVAPIMKKVEKVVEQPLMSVQRNITFDQPEKREELVQRIIF